MASKGLVSIIASACVLVSVGATASGDGPQWSYIGERGPEHWGDLAPAFIQCKVGLNQSPVDITNTVDAELPALELNYTGSTDQQTGPVRGGPERPADIPGRLVVLPLQRLSDHPALLRRRTLVCAQANHAHSPEAAGNI